MAGSSRCIRRRPKTLLGGTGRGSKRQRDLRATEEGVVTRSGGSAMASANTPVRRLASVEELVVPDKNEPDLTPNEVDQFPSSNTQCNGHDLVGAISDSNAPQRQAVSDIGMGGVLRFEITDPPLRLGQWLVSIFDPSDCSLQLAGVVLHG